MVAAWVDGGIDVGIYYYFFKFLSRRGTTIILRPTMLHRRGFPRDDLLTVLVNRERQV
jgi:hypothetical protein